jgi:hypothetical protein
MHMQFCQKPFLFRFFQWERGVRIQASTIFWFSDSVAKNITDKQQQTVLTVSVYCCDCSCVGKTPVPFKCFSDALSLSLPSQYSWLFKFTIHLVTRSVTQIISHRIIGWLVNNELEWKCKRTVVVYFKLPPLKFSCNNSERPRKLSARYPGPRPQILPQTQR